MRHFLHLAYQGTRYRGWQRQANVNSVQQTIEEHFSKILKQQTYIYGCGRTDAEVHASQYFAQIDIPADLNFDLVQRINYILPNDISIYEIIPVPQNSNAQRDAVERQYQYYIHLDKTAILHNTSSYYHIDQLNLDSMRAAIDILKETQDFRSLCKGPDVYKHTLCDIKDIQLSTSYNDKRLKLTITSNRFLRAMIRNIVARLLEIGQGKLCIKKFEDIVSRQESFEYPHVRQAHPQGLYLSKVVYPYLERELKEVVFFGD